VKPLSDAQYAFKAAVRRAVKMAGGPNAATDVVRVDAPRLSRYGNIDAPEYAPIDVCFDLDKAAGDPVILRAWADLMGFDLVPREEVVDQLKRDVTALAGGIAKESGAVVSEAIEAVQNGKPSLTAARAFDEAAADLQERVVDIRARVRKSAAQAL
jgi:hypothetical protein